MEGGFSLHHSTETTPWRNKAGLKDIEKELENELCQVTLGEIPQWLHGSLYHQGGGAFTGDDEKSFLDGLAHIFAFHFDKGQVRFTNKYMRTQHFRKFISQGKREWTGTASAGTKAGLLGRTLDKLSAAVGWDKAPKALYNSVNPNVTTWLIGSPERPRLAAVTEAEGVVCEFDPKTLSTLGAVRTMPTDGFIVTNAAHWFLNDEANGGYHVALDLAWKVRGLQPTFTFKYLIYHGTEAPYRKVAELPLATFKYSDRDKQTVENRASYMHTIVQTDNYVVLVNSCKRLKYGDLLTGKMDGGFFGLFETLTVPVEFIVFRISDKANAKLEYVDRISCPPGQTFMVWHLANCFEQDGKIVIDAAVGKAQEGVTEALTANEKHNLTRFEIDLDAKEATWRTLLDSTDDEEYEFPNINPAFHMKPYRYIYALSNPLSMDGKKSGVVRVDVSGQEDPKYLEGLKEASKLTEPIFVPRPGGKGELDGIVLVEEIDMETGGSELLLCDPETFAVRAKVEAPIGANFGLHSTWLDADQLKLTCKY